MLQVRERIEHIAQPHGTMPIYTTLPQHTVISFERKEPLPVRRQLVLQCSKVVSGQKPSKKKNSQGIQGQAMILHRIYGTLIFHLEQPSQALWLHFCVM